MISYVNRNSLAATISSFTDSLKEWVLEPSEALTKIPSGFTSMMASTLGKLNAYGFFDMIMSKAELNPSTAIRMKSLLRHLKSDTLDSIYGAPSTMTFILSYPEEALIHYAVPVSYGVSKLTLNKNAQVIIPGKPNFTFDYDIDIYVNKFDSNNEIKYSLYAMYNVNTLENGNLFTTANPFLISRNDVVIEDRRFLSIFIPVRQYYRDTQTFELSGENKDINITYTDSLVGFTVLYKSPSSTEFGKVNTYPEGSRLTDGMLYSTTEVNGIKTINIKFSKIPNTFSPVNGALKIIVYTTLGSKGNFVMPNIASDNDESLSGLTMTMAQDTSNVYEEALLPIVPTGSLSVMKAEGGKDALSIEEVRALVISRMMSTIITPASLHQESFRAGFSEKKVRHDLMEWEYKLSKSLKDKSGNIIPSRTIDVNFLFSEIPNHVETNSRIIAPYDIFHYSDSDKQYNYLPLAEIDSYTDYLDKYKLGSLNDYLFPYFIRIQNGQRILIEPYELSINETRATSFVYIANNILDKTSIMHADFIRNPLDTGEVIIKGNHKKLGSFYQIYFTVHTSNVIIDHLKALGENELPFVKFKIIIKNKTDLSRYVLEIDPEDYIFNDKKKSIQCTGFLETNNAILNNGRINIINNSLTKIPYSAIDYQFYFIDGEVDTEFVVIFKENNSGVINASEYDMYLSPQEVMDNYYIGVIYKVDDIVLARNVGEHFPISHDIKLTQPIYKVTDKDVPEIYEEIVYKEENGNYVKELEPVNLPDGSIQNIEKFVILHNKGDIRKENDGRIGTYDIGNQTSIWSNEAANEGVYNTGDILGGNAIYASVKTNDGLIIFGGKEGRIGCYDVNRNLMFPYNTSLTYRDGSNGEFIVKSDGSPMGYEDIRAMLVIQVKDLVTQMPINLLVIAGDKGRVASCNLSTGVWCHFDGTKGDAIAQIYNNGAAMGASTIYCIALYENALTPDKVTIIYGGGDGRLCCTVRSASGILAWYSYDSVNYDAGVITNDGKAMGYKAILSMTNYLNNILFLAGILGHIATCKLATRQFTNFDAGTGIHSGGEVIGGVSIYASGIINSVYVVAGEEGRVANYDIAKGIWTSYDQIGLASKGEVVDKNNINAIETHDNYVIFGSDGGLVASYNIFTNEWTPYNSQSGIRNNGNFIKSSISSIIKYNSIIYFTGKAGNVIFKYRSGDIMVDENGQFIVERPSELRGIIKALPVYDRIYAVRSSYFDILKSYNDMITEVDSLSTKFPQGCKLTIGIKNTSGKSSTFKFVNIKTREEEFLDNLSLSLSLGVKFDSNLTDDDKRYLVNEILIEIRKYVQEIQEQLTDTVVRLNFNTMLDVIKTRVPNIVYFEIYSINNYDANVCQTIFWKKDVMDTTVLAEEYLSVKNYVDEGASDIANQTVVFKPAIDIVVL